MLKANMKVAITLMEQVIKEHKTTNYWKRMLDLSRNCG